MLPSLLLLLPLSTARDEGRKEMDFSEVQEEEGEEGGGPTRTYKRVPSTRSSEAVSPQKTPSEETQKQPETF